MQELTKFQQQLQDAADEIATRRSAWILADANNRYDKFAENRLIEAQKKFHALLIQVERRYEGYGYD